MIQKEFYARYVKRILDVVISLVILVIFSPVFLVLSILIIIKLGTPIFFCQKRIGKDNKTFTLIKFRSMTGEKNKKGELLSDAERLTSFGKVMRATSLDELPELINILFGDMSLIGPRPLPVIYFDYYTDEELKRHSVKPGLTGLAQVNGRNAISWEEKFFYDLKYIKSISLGMDMKILLKTVINVLQKKDIGQGSDRPESLHIQRKENRRRD